MTKEEAQKTLQAAKLYLIKTRQELDKAQQEYDRAVDDNDRAMDELAKIGKSDFVKTIANLKKATDVLDKTMNDFSLAGIGVNKALINLSNATSESKSLGERLMKKISVKEQDGD